MDLLEDLKQFLSGKPKQAQPKRNLELEKKAEALPKLPFQPTHEGVAIPLHDTINEMYPLLMQQMNKQPGIPSSNAQTTTHRSPWEYIEQGIPKSKLQDMFLQREGKGMI